MIMFTPVRGYDLQPERAEFHHRNTTEFHRIQRTPDKDQRQRPCPGPLRRFLVLQHQDAENPSGHRREFRVSNGVRTSDANISSTIESILSLHKYNALREANSSRHKSGSRGDVCRDMKPVFNKILVGLKEIDQKIKARQNVHREVK
jgi:hypothetical protein